MHSNVMEALLFLVNTVFTLYIIVLLVRVLLQTTGAPFHNPVSQFVWHATVRPVRLVARVMPRWRNVDVPAIALILLLCYINIEVVLWIVTARFGVMPIPALGWALAKALALLCNLYFFTILAQALLSWLAPQQYSPATVILWSLNEPLLRPVRNRLPPVAGLDLSPLVVLIALQCINLLLPRAPFLG